LKFQPVFFIIYVACALPVLALLVKFGAKYFYELLFRNLYIEPVGGIRARTVLSEIWKISYSYVAITIFTSMIGGTIYSAIIFLLSHDMAYIEIPIKLLRLYMSVFAVIGILLAVIARVFCAGRLQTSAENTPIFVQGYIEGLFRQAVIAICLVILFVVPVVWMTGSPLPTSILSALSSSWDNYYLQVFSLLIFLSIVVVEGIVGLELW